MTAPLESLVTLDNFKLWPGVIVNTDGTDDASANYVLLAASNFVRMESGNPSRWSDTTTDPCPAAVVTVIVQVAARIWRNPDAATLRATGPFTDQFTQTVEAGLYLTDTERRIVERATARPALWTMALERDADVYPSSTYDLFSGATVPSSPYPPDTWLYGPPA